MINFVRKPKILLPVDNIDLNKWSVVACDQFTSQPEYWQSLKEYIGDAPSSLNLIFPEVYLSGDKQEYTKRINATMDSYLKNNLFKNVDDMILVKRIIPNGKVRLGIMLEVDLEAYEYTPSNHALIKATERTVVERLPIRIDVRRNASLELPHIMLLVDDPNNTVIEPIYADMDGMEELYNFELNMGGGRLEGAKIKDSNRVLESLSKLLEPDVLQAKYNTVEPMLFAVGDGNHSLATAKECWNKIKKTLSKKEKLDHPARFALCELVNLHDESLEFEPIHRVIKGVNEDFIVEMARALDGKGRLRLEYLGKKYILNIPDNPSDAIKDIQDFIDEYISENEAVEQDYIHGDEHLLKVVERDNSVAIFMPKIAKESLFDYVIRRGVLPRKAFSMGVAEDKKYYLEARKIIK